MIIPHTAGNNRLQSISTMVERLAARALEEALQDTPVVLIHGPRQSGKSTLAQAAAKNHFGGNYVTLDDPLILEEARTNPSSFIKGKNPPLVIDEVQRAPELFLAIKLFIDRNRKPGQFLLTGSANVLVLPKVADSLAGRMEPIDLLPFSQAELEVATSNFTDMVFGKDLPAGFHPSSKDDLVQRIAKGGFPEPVQRSSESRREAWFQSYVRTVLDRDVRDLSNVTGLTQMPRLLALLSARSGSTLNISSLSVDTGVPHTTLTRYIDLFKALFLVHLVPAWSANVETRLAKSSKAFIVDTGLLCYLTGMDAKALATDALRFEPALKTFVANELQKLSSAGRVKPWLFHLRTVKQKQVDFVLEARDGRVVGVDVVAGHAVSNDDFEGLRFLAELTGARFHRGVILYDGDEVVSIGPHLVAMPITALWSP